MFAEQKQVMEKSHDLVMYMYDDLKLDIKGWPIRRPLKTSLKSFSCVCVCIENLTKIENIHSFRHFLRKLPTKYLKQTLSAFNRHDLLVINGEGAKMCTPENHENILSQNVFVPKCLLCQNVYSQNVYS